jgi:hypothetical protein
MELIEKVKRVIFGCSKEETPEPIKREIEVGSRVQLVDSIKYVGDVVKIKENEYVIQWDTYSKGNLQPYAKDKVRLI